MLFRAMPCYAISLLIAAGLILSTHRGDTIVYVEVYLL